VISLIKLNHLNKYFSQGKSRPIHVIDNISLTFESTGLIAILGKSGSGKTTLLNVIGGLDAASGEIIYDDISFKRYRMNDIDTYRNEHIGYVFQNYLLLTDSSVGENIGLALRMAGFTDTEEIVKRTNAALESVGMLKYKRRNANALSGGQQQRVAIARALAKDASIIIADEPTGNLDSENSYEIMCILKKLSETRLVILVTHNETLAHDFGDRIIGYADGKIVSDVTNSSVPKSSKSQTSLSKLQESKVYLGELKNQTSEVNGINVTSYTDEDERLSLDLKVVTLSGKTYLLFDDTAITANPNLQFIPGKAPVVETTGTPVVDSKFDTSGFKGKTQDKINVWLTLKNALGRFFRPKKTRSKVFNVSMAVLGATLATISVIVYSTVTNYSAIDYFDNFDRNAVYVDDAGQYGESIAIKDFADIISDETSGVTGSYRAHRANNALKNFSMLRLPYTLDSNSRYYNDISNNSYQQIYGYPSLFGLDSEAIVAGVMPSAPFECTIDRSFITKIKTVYSIRELTDDIILGSTIKIATAGGNMVGPAKIVGITNVGSFNVMFDDIYGPKICQDILLQSYSLFHTILDDAEMFTYAEKTPLDITASGTVSDTLPNAWVSSAFLDLATRMDYTMAFNVVGSYPEEALEVILTTSEDVDLYMEQQSEQLYSESISGLGELNGVTLSSGRLPSDTNEIVVSRFMEGVLTPSWHEYTIVGYVDTSFENRYAWYGTPATTEYQLFILSNIEKINMNPKNTLGDILTPLNLILSNDVEKTVSFFSSKGHYAEKYGTFVNSKFLASSFASNSAFLVTFAILLGVIVLLFYMTTRAKMIKNIYPIGVYRSLGTKREKIMRLFLSDTIIQATFTNVLSFVVISILLTSALAKVGMNGLPLWVYAVGIIFSYGVPLFATWLPLAQLLSKTPHQITTKYDI